MQSTRWLTAALTVAALTSLPVVSKAQGEKGERTERMEKMGGKGALSVTAELSKAGKIAFNATDIAYEVSSPRDLASGMASGKRMRRPITLTAELGDWSTKLYQAAETNEVIRSVTIELGSGHSLLLKNATISSFRLGTDANGKLIQEVSLVGQDVEMK